MRMGGKRGNGLRGALAFAFIAAAGGGAYAFAKRDAAPVTPGTTTAILAVEKAPVVEGSKGPAKAPESVVEVAEKADKTPGSATAGQGSSEGKNDAKGRAAIEAGEAALAKGDARVGLLELRKAARSRTASPEQAEAREKMAKIAAAALAEANDAKAKDDPVAERAALTRAFFATLDKGTRNAWLPRLDELAKKTTLSPRFTADGDVYTVKQGDRLIGIARANKTTWSFVKRVNGLKTDSIRVGQKLKIPRGIVELSVFKTDFQIVVTIGGQFVRAFDVGTGREDRTPESTFKIAERLEKPTWYAPDGKVYPFGTKENILGTRWMGFEKTDDFVGFGIHGTAFPETIGTESSAGCIRMRNEEVEELFDFVAEGTLVTIVR